MRAAGVKLIRTDVEPFTMTSGGPTQVHMEPTFAAGMKPIITVGAPTTTGPPTWGTTPVTIGQTCMSVIRAAGNMVLLSILSGRYRELTMRGRTSYDGQDL